ncbi:MAG: FecR family protein [Pseudomonadota bacterium]
MSILLKKFFAVLSASAVILTFGAALAGDWQVIETAGTVRTTNPTATAQPVSTGQALGGGAVLTTGFDGRAVLLNGRQQIVIGPNSRMSLPAADEAGMTRILQDLGTLLFKVDKREEQHFQVETPIIAAVVKGTTFTVTAGANSHAVHVAEGAVEVAVRSGSATELVTAGRTVRVYRNNPSAIQFTDKPMGDRGRKGEGKGGFQEGRDDRDARDSDILNGKREASLDPAEGGADRLLVPAAIGAEPLDFATLSDGLVRSSLGDEAVVGVRVVNAVQGEVGLRLDDVASARLNAINNNNIARAIADAGNGVGSNVNGVGVGAGIGIGKGDGRGIGVDIGNGNGTGIGVDVGNGAGTGIGVDIGNGNGAGIGVDIGNGNGIGVGIGNGNGNGIDVDIGNGSGIGIGLGLGSGGDQP